MVNTKVKQTIEMLSLTSEDKKHINGEGIERLIEPLIKMFPNRQISSILDVGCGDGTIAYCLEKMLNVKLVGIDCDAEFLSRAEKKGIAVFSLNIETGKFPFPDNSFSHVICIEVLEHLSKPEHCLNEIARILKTNGELILTTPNLADLGGRLSIISGKDPLRAIPYERAYDRHIRLYAKNSLQELLSNWFIITKVAYCNSYGRKTWKGIFRDALCHLDSSLCGTILVSCRKK